MPEHVLLSPAGFTDWKTIQVFLDLAFDHMVFARTSHRKARQHLDRVRTAATKQGIGFEEVEIRPAFDLRAWQESLSNVVANHRRADITMNLTAGHGVAIAAATMVAISDGIPCVCYDVVEGRLFRVNPSAAMQMASLGSTEREILRLLNERARTVTDLQRASRLKPSTVSMALQRLRTSAWVESVREGKAIRYDIHPGAQQLLARL